MDFDTIIVGAGIAGLYIGLYLKAHHPDHSVALLERSERIGGRIYSGRVSGKSYEIGAGRISSSNELLLQLIRHYDLPLKEIDSHFSYRGSRERLSYGEIMLTLTPIIALLLSYSTLVRKRDLARTTVERLADRCLTRHQRERLLELFPYRSELRVENAYEGLKAIADFSPLHSFYVVEKGFDRLVGAMSHDFQRLGGRILLNHRLNDLEVNKAGFLCLVENRRPLSARRVMVTANLDGLRDIAFFDQYQPLFRELGLHTEPLLRIYAQYPVRDGPWFAKVGRVATDLPIKLVIPIDGESGLVMIAYADGDDARWWEPLVATYDRSPDGLIGVIQDQLHELFPELDIPEPLWLEPYYWPDGGNFNRPNRSGLTARALRRRIDRSLPDNLWLINNALSDQKNWVEGSLQLAYEMLPTLLSKGVV
jgi:phytoene dehydrogenase-like protein